MCDETASSRGAPPPILPIRDVKLEAGGPCEEAPTGLAPIAVVPLGPRAPQSPVIQLDAIATEAWVTANVVSLRAPVGGRCGLGEHPSVPLKPGFSRSVFRPPRG